jgi:hypothetical protein
MGWFEVAGSVSADRMGGRVLLASTRADGWELRRLQWLGGRVTHDDRLYVSIHEVLRLVEGLSVRDWRKGNRSD